MKIMPSIMNEENIITTKAVGLACIYVTHCIDTMRRDTCNALHRYKKA
jgi:hypothetical protein